MGNVWLTWMADAIEAAGVPVVRYSGWTTRSRSTGGYEPGRPLCVMWHHTASATTPDNDAYYMCYSSDSRPITNLMVDRTGTVWVLAAGATNTNGKGKSLSFSRGKVPQDRMNEYAVSMEICNNGVGEAYPRAQIDAAFTVSNVLNADLGNQPDDVSTHQFYAPDRKIDPATANAVQGPWVPRSCTSSGTWDLWDVRSECILRANPNPPEVDMANPASIYLGGGRLDNFVTGANDGRLYHNWWDVEHGHWSPWQDLGGGLAGDPCVTGETDGAGTPLRLDVCGQGLDGALWHIFYPAGPGQWSGWERVADWPG